MPKNSLWSKPILLIEEIIRYLNFPAETLLEGIVYQKRGI